MAISKESRALLALLRGERVYKPPFWEVWFAMDEFFRRRYRDHQEIQKRIRMAYDLGMAAVNLGSIDINSSFRKDEVVRDGSSRYVGGSLVSLEQLEERELPDWSKAIQQWKRDHWLIKKSGLI